MRTFGGGNYVYPDINSIDDRLKACDLIKQAHIEWEVEVLSENRMVKGLHKVFKDVLNKV